MSYSLSDANTWMAPASNVGTTEAGDAEDAWDEGEALNPGVSGLGAAGPLRKGAGPAGNGADPATKATGPPEKGA